MASAEQLKALLRSHIEGDGGRFLSVAMQVAAHEAKLGHGKLAEELRDMIDAAKSHGRNAGTSMPVPLNKPRKRKGSAQEKGVSSNIPTFCWNVRTDPLLCGFFFLCLKSWKHIPKRNWMV